MTLHPPLAPAQLLAGRLTAAGIEAALGGSGLLFAHGLVDRVGDWDLTTDAPPDQIRTALQDLPFTEQTGGQNYATAGRFVFHLDGAQIDLISRFTVRTPGGLCHLPTLVSGSWQGLPLGSLTVWLAAYTLIDRPARAALLLAHLRQRGADQGHLDRLLPQPLPPALLTTLESLI